LHPVLSSKIFYTVFVAAFIISVALLSGIGYPSLKLYERTVLDQVANKEQLAFDSTSNIILNKFNEAVNNLLVLAELPYLTDYLTAPNLENREILEEHFSSQIENHVDYSQIRLLNQQGKELIRADKTKAGPQITPENNLQSKASRYYFIDAYPLKAGKVYLSELDLNIENNQIVRPYEPMLRLATPVFDNNNVKKGVLVFNVLGQSILDLYRRTYDDKTVDSMLLNDRGDWLLSSDGQHEFDFMLNDKPVRFSQEYPDIWQSIQTMSKGSVVSEQGIYYFQKLYPIKPKIEPSSKNNSNMNHAPQDRYWVMVRFWSNATLDSLLLHRQLAGKLILSGILFLITISSGLLALLTHMQVRSQQKLVREIFLREEEYKGYIESAPDGIVVSNTTGTILLTNTKLESMLGYNKGELIGSSIDILVPNRAKYKHPALRRDFVAQNTAREMGAGQDIWARTKSGLEIPVDINLDFVKTPRGTQIISAVRDVSLLRKYQQQLQQASKEAASASEQKTNFLAQMSHEIRTPLNSIIGTTYRLLKNFDPKTAQGEITRIDAAGQLLLNIVSDILDLDKIEAGQFELEQNTFRLSRVLTKLKFVHQSVAESKGLTLSIPNADKQWNINLVGDNIRLKQILSNLLSNAIKYTSEGEVAMEIEDVTHEYTDPVTKYVESEQRWLSFTVVDSGIGIAPDLLPNVFEPFKQADISITRKYGGTGLGLAIVRELCIQMGGTVNATSQPDVGSRFKVSLPFLATTAQEVDPHNQIKRPLKLLLRLDDEKLTSRIISQCECLGWLHKTVVAGSSMNTPLGFNVDDASDVDCVIVDSELLSKTGNSDSTNAIGSNQIIAPPPENAAELAAQINALMTSSKSGAFHLLDFTKIDQPDIQWLHGLRIMVVEDNAMNQHVIENLLTDGGARVVLQDNGLEAVKWLQKNTNEIDIILMDLEMPVMDGYTAVDHIKADSSTNSIPIIGLSARAMVADKAVSLQKGMVEYLTKPINPEQLTRIIRQYVEPANFAVFVDRATTKEATTNFDHWPQITFVDLDDAKIQCGGNVELFKQLITQFVVEFETEIGQLAIPDSASAIKQQKSLLHRLLSTSGLIGANYLAQTISTAQHLLQQEKWILLGEELRSLSAEFYALKSSVEKQITIHPSTRTNSSFDDVNRHPIDLAKHASKLKAALKNHEWSALQLFEQFRTELLGQVDQRLLDILGREIVTFRYADAIVTLERLIVETELPIQ